MIKLNVLNFTIAVNKIDFTNSSCLIIGILSHGERFDQIYAKGADKLYKVTDHIVYPLINGNSSLTEVPKFVFVQACKGNVLNRIRPDEVGILPTEDQEGYQVEDEDGQSIALNTTKPTGSPHKYLRFNSTFEGFKSIRHVSWGTPFINALCNTILEIGDKGYLWDIVTNTMAKVKEISKHLKTLDKDFV